VLNVKFTPWMTYQSAPSGPTAASVISCAPVAHSAAVGWPGAGFGTQLLPSKPIRRTVPVK
jgi:hypothetical protein